MLGRASTEHTLRQVRYAFAVAQLELRRLRLLRARKLYNPNQPRVPAGNPDGGQWTDAGGGGARADYAQLRPRPLTGGYRIIGGRAHAVTPGQEARFDVTAAQARALVREVQRHDPNWRPQPSIYQGVEGAIRANESDALQAAARLRQLGVQGPPQRPLVDILMPGRQPIGTRHGYASSETRTVGRTEFSNLLEVLTPQAARAPSPVGYLGEWFRRPDGSIFGVRRSNHGMTIDVIRSTHPGIENGYKVHKK